MELSMAMRFIRIKARQKAQNGPVYAEHTLSALLMLAGSDAKAVMPSGTDAAKAAIADEIADLRGELDSLYGIGDPAAVMERLDELIGAGGVEEGVEREFAALLTDAERWMDNNPGRGDMIAPVAMLHAVRGKAELMLDEAIMTAGGTMSGTAGSVTAAAGAGAGAPFDPEATMVDTHVFGAGETAGLADIADDLPDGGADAEEAERREREAEEAARQERLEAIEAERREREAREEAERRERERAEAERRVQEAEDARRDREAADEAIRNAVLQQAVQQAMQQMEEEAGRNKRGAKGGNPNGKAFGAFLGFLIVMIVAWQVFLRAGAATGDEPAWWMKVLFFVVYLIALIVSVRSIGKLQNNPNINASQTTMMRIRVIGTPGMIYFKTLLLSTIFPAILLFILGLALGTGLSPFWYHFLSIYVFCWGCGMVNVAFQSNVSALSVGYLSYDQLKKKRGALVGTSLSGVLTIPALVLFLHWHFDWFPMKTWVIVVLIIFLVFGLSSCAVLGRQNLQSLQNDGV